MKIGIFAKTFSRPTIAELFETIAGYEIYSAQFNLSCAGLETLPGNVVSSELVRQINGAAEHARVELSAMSGTFNMAHPDPAVRRDNLTTENVVNSANRARKLLDEMQNPRLRIVIDPANLIGPGRKQEEVLDESFALLSDAIVIAHAKDRTAAFKACAAGKGILDFEYYLRLLKQGGFAGPLVMHGLEEEEVTFSRDFLRRNLAL